MRGVKKYSALPLGAVIDENHVRRGIPLAGINSS
jgi:hypothetical protein